MIALRLKLATWFFMSVWMTGCIAHHSDAVQNHINETHREVEQPIPLAVVSGHEVHREDARALQALLQPPPSLEQAERLVIQMAIAYRAHHESLEGVSVKDQWQFWREWVKSLPFKEHSSLGLLIEDEITKLEAQLNLQAES